MITLTMMPGSPHLDTADPERLIRVVRVREAPDVGREHHGHDGGGAAPQADSRQVLVEERHREHARRELFGDRREEADEEHERPREAGVQEIAVGHFERRPGAEARRRDVEDRLVGGEEQHQHEAEQHFLEEALGAQAAPAEERRQRQLAGVALAVHGLGGGGEQHDEAAEGERSQHGRQPELGHEGRIAVLRLVVELLEIELVERRQELQHERHGPESDHRRPAHVAVTNAQHQRAGHRQPGEHQEQEGDDRCRVVAGAQLRVVVLPGLWDVEELVVAGDMISRDGDRHPVGGIGIAEVESLFLPGEGVVDAVRLLRRARFHEVVVGEPQRHRLGEELFGQRARRVGFERSTRRFFREQMPEVRDLAAGRDVDAQLFLVVGLEPAMAPAPQPHLLAVELLGALEAELAFQERLGVVVVVEHRGVFVAGARLAEPRQERFGNAHRLAAIDLELDGGFGEGAPEVAQRDRAADDADHQAAEHEAPVARFEAFEHPPPPSRPAGHPSGNARPYGRNRHTLRHPHPETQTLSGGGDPAGRPSWPLHGQVAEPSDRARRRPWPAEAPGCVGMDASDRRARVIRPFDRLREPRGFVGSTD
jgi:hypothetical protein